METITRFCLKMVQKYLPGAFLLAIFLTFVTFISGMVITGKSASAMVNYWGKGYSSLFTFGMQMVLVFGAARFFGEVSDDIAVLVVLADASDIGTTEDMETDVSRLGWRSLSHLTFEFSHPYASSTRNKCCPTRMESPSCRAQSPRIATNEPFDEFKSSSVKVPEELDRRMTACLLDK